MEGVLADLAGEQQALDSLVADLDETGWATATPAEGWNITDQISHLAYFDEQAARTVTDPDGFVAMVAELMASPDPWGLEDEIMAQGRAMSGPELLEWWRSARAQLQEAMAGADARSAFPGTGRP